MKYLPFTNMMQIQKCFLTCTLLVATMLLSGCDKDDPEPVNEEELVTTVALSFQRLDDNGNPTGDAQVFRWKDMDGDGPNAPVIDQISLAANAKYLLTLQFLNESENPVEDVTEEIEAEKDDHQLFFQPAPASLMTIIYADTDNNGTPVGLRNAVSTTAAGSGTLKVTLIHEPVKTAPGVAAGNIANAGGETDIEVEFPVTIN
jgi:hypothetical protein